ncbi:hypothetical protein TUBRATIS_006040 [Tubulinosema ratisbonensis]|uniref:Uncharacterized protein n=1 Tax=Tubulinosema ratisbonensis TaxID=291195 RepID=A0A437ANS8_9MICR|nr:hypothetical protein TUBRATIS_006040 [Tubulinosema ratisbonensis]
MKILHKYTTFSFISLLKIYIFMYFIKKEIIHFHCTGVKVRPIHYLGYYIYILRMFISYIGMSHSFLTNKFVYIMIYYIFSIIFFMSTTILLPFVKAKIYFVFFYGIQLVEYVFVYSNLKDFCSRAIFQKNSKIGTDLKIKKALNVSIKIIRLDL